MNEAGENFLIVKNVKKYFPITKGIIKHTVGQVKAVDGVSFSINKGETLGLVGESGCGKSTLGRTILNLIPATEGSIVMDGVDIGSLSPKEMRKQRCRMQMIFQDPYSSLNPRMTVGEMIMEPMIVHRLYKTAGEREEKMLELLELVGLNADSAFRYAHEFSGGQRQRIGIARALALNPDLIVCDEPVSALDVSVRSQVLNLMSDLQQKFNLTYIMISHDLSVIKHTSSRVAVMYLGRIVELADKKKLYAEPMHPYTKALMSAIPLPDPHSRRERIILEGDVPSPVNPPEGCHFHPRCPYATDRCRKTVPELIDMGDGHCVACHLAEKGI